jgi:hypothetical protein
MKSYGISDIYTDLTTDVNKLDCEHLVITIVTFLLRFLGAAAPNLDCKTVCPCWLSLLIS